MGRLTLSQIFQQISATVNQDPTAPTAGGSDYNLWLQFANRAVQEWAESADWEDLRRYHYPTLSGMSNPSVGLPQNFKKLAGAPRLYDGSANGWTEFPVIIPEQESLYNKQTDKYTWIFGDLNDGYSLQWNPATLASGASVQIPYFSIPTSLASPNDVPLVPDSQFIVDRVIAYVFEARSDPRFQEQEQKAREKLLQMVEYNNLNKYNSYGGKNYVTNATRLQGFRIGRD